jgi:hypothetical protein
VAVNPFHLVGRVFEFYVGHRFYAWFYAIFAHLMDTGEF